MDARSRDPDRDAGTDMDPEAFRAAAHQVVDLMADYLAGVERYPVFPAIEPGSLGPLFPASAPEQGEAIEAILADYTRLIEPNATHWQHPGFLAYFGTTASGPGILGEMLTAALGQNPMLWRTSPIGTELEGVVVDWLRQGLGLPEGWDGLLTDTASTSSLIALAGARQAAGIDAAARGLPGRPDVPALRVYASQEAHSSIEKACMTLGLGRDALVRIETDEDYALRPDALEAAIAADRAAGHRPIAIVATVGTTSSTAIDPVAAIADIAEREGLWLHVDTAYAGAVALIPERRGAVRRLGARGLDRGEPAQVAVHAARCVAAADAAACRRCATRSASCPSTCARSIARRRSATTTSTRPSSAAGSGRSSCGCSCAGSGWRGCASASSATWRWPRRSPPRSTPTRPGSGWRPCPFSTVCFRWVGDGSLDEATLDARNAAIMDAVNRTGEVFLSHTRLDGRFTIRLAIGNLRTEERHVERAWELLRAAAAERAATTPA